MEQNLLEIVTGCQLSKKLLMPWKPNVHYLGQKKLDASLYVEVDHFNIICWCF
jgi:hypothetical protein